MAEGVNCTKGHLLRKVVIDLRGKSHTRPMVGPELVGEGEAVVDPKLEPKGHT